MERNIGSDVDGMAWGPARLSEVYSNIQERTIVVHMPVTHHDSAAEVLSYCTLLGYCLLCRTRLDYGTVRKTLNAELKFPAAGVEVAEGWWCVVSCGW